MGLPRPILRQARRTVSLSWGGCGPPSRNGAAEACLWLALGTQAFPDERKNLAGAGGGGASVGASWPPPQPANRYRGLGWALRACDGARADELSKDYRALRT